MSEHSHWNTIHVCGRYLCTALCVDWGWGWGDILYISWLTFPKPASCNRMVSAVPITVGVCVCLVCVCLCVCVCVCVCVCAADITGTAVRVPQTDGLQGPGAGGAGDLRTQPARHLHPACAGLPAGHHLQAEAPQVQHLRSVVSKLWAQQQRQVGGGGGAVAQGGEGGRQDGEGRGAERERGGRGVVVAQGVGE